MRLSKNQSGFSAVEAVLVVLLVGLLLFVGYTFYNSQLASDTEPNISQPSDSDEVPTAPEIDSEGDLDNASDTLDQVDIDESNDSDSSQLDSETGN